MARHHPAGERWSVASRAAAAILGGYAFTWLFTAGLALLLHHVWAIAREDSLLMATTISFLFYAAAVIGVFCARSATRAWIGMLLASVPPAVVLVFFLWGGHG